MTVPSLMTYGTTNGVLKPLNEVTIPDPRFQFWALEFPEGTRPFELADMHERLTDIRVNSSVPDDVRRHFETARNLMLYAWFVFEFQTVAELQAYAALELGLRTRFPDAKREHRTKNGIELKPLTLRPLLKLAVGKGLIVPDRLPAWERVKSRQAWNEKQSPIPQGKPLSAEEWLQILMKSVPRLRNSLAHGSPRLYLFASISQLDLCADLLNALFRE